MRLHWALLGALLLFAPIAHAADSTPTTPKATEKLPPATYRIVVRYDDLIKSDIEKAIDREVRRAQREHARRKELSEDILQSELRKELGKLDHPERLTEGLDSIKRAADEEKAARERGDLRAAETWHFVRIQRTRDVLDQAKAINAIKESIENVTVQDWRDKRRQERAIAEKALVRLQAILDQIDADKQAP